jgi:hypothetical protein
MLTYAAVCWRMLTYADVCRSHGVLRRVRGVRGIITSTLSRLQGQSNQQFRVQVQSPRCGASRMPRWGGARLRLENRMPRCGASRMPRTGGGTLGLTQTYTTWVRPWSLQVRRHRDSTRFHPNPPRDMEFVQSLEVWYLSHQARAWWDYSAD